jgi:hypothetical protein
MYELPDETELGFLVGREVGQVCIGEFQAQLNFDQDVSIAIQTDFTLDGERRSVSAGYVLHALLGKVVNGVRRGGRADLRLSVGGRELVVHGLNDGYESYTISHRNGLIVV